MAEASSHPVADDERIVIVGAGPAGLSAAAAALDAGAPVLLIDAAEQVGGQYWRHRPRATNPNVTKPSDSRPSPDDAAHPNPSSLPDQRTFAALSDRLRRGIDDGQATHLTSTTVVAAERAPDGVVLYARPTSGAGATTVIRSATVVLCPGAYDRQLPVPGWDLPGVLSAGGAQALSKGSGVLPARRIVVAGTGPFLLTVASGLARAGAEIVALCEASTPRRWLAHPAVVTRQGRKLRQLAEYAGVMARNRIRVRNRTVVTEIVGTDRVRAVRLARLGPDGAPGPAAAKIETDAVALGWGFTPQLELPLMLGAESAVGDDGSLVVRVDARQRSSVPGVFIAGEATGVGGAELAVAEGQVAGRAAAGAPPLQADRRQVVRQRAFARVLHEVYPIPANWRRWLTDATVLCRCEEVTCGGLAQAANELQVADPVMARSLARVGMGRCQGRMCGFATALLLADREGRDVAASDLRSSAARPLGAPVPLADLGEFDRLEG